MNYHSEFSQRNIVYEEDAQFGLIVATRLRHRN